MEELFKGPRLKVKRAEEHINHLSQMISSMTNRDNHVVFIERDIETGDNFLKVGHIESLPDTFPLVLGDALHNLRAALDYVISEIEFIHAGARTGFTKFPISKDRKGFEDAIGGRFKEKAPKEVIEYIEDFIQPYVGGQSGDLWGLHELDIWDKHKLLIPNSEVSLIYGIRIKDDSGMEHTVDTWQVKDRLIVGHPVSGIKNVEITNNGDATYHVSFGQGTRLQGREVISALVRLRDLTLAVIDDIEPVFKRSQIKIY